MASRAGLIPIQKTVVRNGKAYLTTVWIKPGDLKKTNPKQVQMPEWDFKTTVDFENEVARINKLTDPAEKKVFKEQLVKDIIKAGLPFKVDTGDKADSVNWMRALMASKKHLKAGNALNLKDGNTAVATAPKVGLPKATAPKPKAAKPATPAPATQPASTGQPVLGTGQPMDKEDAKKAVKALRDKMGTQELMDLAEANGIQWTKNPNHLANSYMQCAMKLSKHLQNGGTLTDGKTSVAAPAAKPALAKKPEPKLVVAPDKKDNTPKDKKSIEYAYHTATNSAKLVSMVTGMLPTDQGAHDYLKELMDAGKFDLGEVAKGVNITKAAKSGIAHAVRHMDAKDPQLDQLTMEQPNSGRVMFEGSKYEKEFKKYEKDRGDVIEKHGTHAITNGPANLEKQIKIIDMFQEVNGDKDLSKLTQQDAISKLAVHLSVRARDNVAKEADEIFDKFGLASAIDSSDNENPFKLYLGLTGSYNQSARIFDLHLSYAALNAFPKSLTRRDAIQELRAGLVNGTVSKSKALKIVSEAMNDYLKEPSLKDAASSPVTDGFLSNRYSLPNGVSFIKNLSEVGHTGFKPSDVKAKLKSAIADSAPLHTADANFIKQNIFLKSHVERAGHSSVKDWEPIDREDFDKAADKKDLFENHIWYLKKAKSAREAYKKKAEKAALAASPSKKALSQGEYVQAFKDGVDPDTMVFPEHGDVRKFVKSSLNKMPDAEATKVEAHILRTHDNTNHRDFKTVVKGVYNIRGLEIEDSFKKIDAARNNTGFYYHGTDHSATQKILGIAGQFRVTAGNVKAGRMLGDGVYLADNSSKSVQYIGDRFSRGTSRGSLFVCKASLGAVHTSTVTGSSANGPILKRPDVDTVFMGRPHVKNPEWAVKEVTAVLPSLLVDVERVSSRY